MDKKIQSGMALQWHNTATRKFQGYIAKSMGSSLCKAPMSPCYQFLYSVVILEWWKIYGIGRILLDHQRNKLGLDSLGLDTGRVEILNGSIEQIGT